MTGPLFPAPHKNVKWSCGPPKTPWAFSAARFLSARREAVPSEIAEEN